MDLNRIELKPLMLAGLYGGSLVLEEHKAGAETEIGDRDKAPVADSSAVTASVQMAPSTPVSTSAPPRPQPKPEPITQPSEAEDGIHSSPDPSGPFVRRSEAKEGIRALGDNRRHIVVVVDHSEAPVLPDSELQFLTTVLAACKLSLADIAIVNRHSAEPEALAQFLLAPTKSVLLFGVEPLAIGLPINFPRFQVQPFSGRTWICAPPLGAIESDRTLKAGLWNGLKQLFGL